MFFSINPKKRNWNDTSVLNRYQVSKSKKPRLTDGRTGVRTKQNYVSVTVTFDSMNDLRVNRKELALPNCWIDSGIQNEKNIEQVRRGDIAWAVTDAVPFSHSTGITNHTQVFTHLNRWSKTIPIRVVGIVDNPSHGRGQSSAADRTGTISQGGVSTIVNNGPHMIVAGDAVYCLPIPEVTELGGVTWNMNAIQGTGDGSGVHKDYTQKMIGRLVPLKQKDIKLTLEAIRHDVDSHLKQLWNQQKQNISVSTEWNRHFLLLQSNIKSDVFHLFPGMETYALLHFCELSMNRALMDYHLGIDLSNTIDLIKIIYLRAHSLNREYWVKNEHIFSSLSNPDDLRKLANGDGDWLVPMGVITIRESIKSSDYSLDLNELLPNKTFKVDQTKDLSEQIKETKSPFFYIYELLRVINFAQGWIEANDIIYALESYYVGTCTSAQAAPSHQFDISR